MIRIGDFWSGEGGIYAGIMRGVKGKPDYYLIVPTDPSSSLKNIMWSEDYQLIIHANDESDGLFNTKSIINASNGHSLARWATEFTLGEHRDFYLPALRELRLCHANVPELLKDSKYWSSTTYDERSCMVLCIAAEECGFDKRLGKASTQIVRRINLSEGAT